MRVRLALSIFLVSLLLLVSGCWGSMETDDVAYVLSMGFDKGEKNNLIVTFQIANPKAIAGQGGGGGGEPNQNITLVGSVEATAPATAIDLMNTATTRRLSLLHTKAFLFSEELAREGLGKWLTPLNRLREFRETASVYIVRGKASEFLEKNQPLLEITPSKQYELISQLPKVNSYFLPMQFHTFYEQVKSPSVEPNIPLVAIHEGGLRTGKPGPLQGGSYETGPYLAGEVPIAGKNVAQFIGNAVFRGDKMVGKLDGTETRIYLMLRGKFNRATVNLPDPIAGPEYFVGLNHRQARKPEYHTRILQDGTVIIDIDIYLEPDIVAIASGINYEDPKKKLLLEKAIIEVTEQRCDDLIRRSQEDFRSDIFGFGLWVKHHFLTHQEWSAFDWSKRFMDAQVNVQVHAKIRRTGLQLKTSKRGE